jgi:flagellar hook protein FlgE
MYIAVTALKAQSANVSAISNNLANSETIGYKTTNATFASLVTGTGSVTNFTGAGVIVDPSQNISDQGLIVGTNSSTDLAIDGDGFFVVTDSAGGDVYYYTRAGDFHTDADGNLVNSNGYYLQGYPTDTDGEVTGDLETVNLEEVNGTAVATDEISIEANLPADAEVGDVVTTEVEIYDSQGVAHTVNFSYTKTADNTWTMAATADDGTVTLTDTGGADITATGATITFNEDGTLAASDLGSIDIAWTASGAADSSITYDAGTSGMANGLSQYASSDGEADIEVDTIDQNGVQYGSFYSATVTEDGMVYANFSNGISYPIYQVPLATFPNANGLEAVSGTAYSPTVESGSATLNNPNTADAGSINAGAVESSTVDTADEFSNLIVAQQAYSAASEIISTAQEMFDDLISAKR